jgi:hypothetical protein
VLAVLFRVMFSGFIRVVTRVRRMAVRRVRVVGGLFVLAVIVMLGRFTMVLCSVLMMLGRLGVVLRPFVFHGFLLGLEAVVYNKSMTLLGMPLRRA